MSSTISREKLEKYFFVASKALDIAENNISKGESVYAEVILDTARRYVSDARHFEKKGDIVTAFAALNYAHGWLDAGARLGIFDVKDSTLFAVDN
ncbi:DUF357 domain-containing protein [Candidatus Woesearchaeota archaeon]|nr:DUF357 domain-containing protein [Candidatus Woesearchaeota archaeon]